MKMKYLLGVSLVAAPLLLSQGGCSHQITADSVRSNMSPEMETMAQTSEQRKNEVARAVDTNLRQLNNDWDSFWLLDRPLRLSMYPVPLK